MSDNAAPGTRDWIETSALTAPALLGAAAGLLVGDLMHRSARRGIALALGGLGIAALLPMVVDGIANRVNGPCSARGARRRLEKIRDAGAGTVGFDDVDAELREQGLI